ncbi:hypothetical protein [Actinomadura sp. HBU206391]|uniref:hypothetical protein n=1 Tax=Actinomadura sp. HBU206391 TaxID=2731692 RepID=UPI0016503EF4|nr:hypothetical protein [Actinomadura sp. HBU206391]MBC6460509.1 hypothetical protein [Actinomadura sp. HBU206391]
MTEVLFLVALAAARGSADGALDPVFDDLTGRAGIPAVVWGALPHQPGFWSVRGAAPRLIGAEPGAAYFQPDPALWSGLRLAPRTAAAIGRHDPLAEGCAEAARLGLSSHIRVSVLRNPRLATRHPDCAQRDVRGRPHPWGLCPSNPDVRAYVETLITDLARYGAESVRLDWLHFAGLASSPPDSSLWAPCFCRHCRTALTAWCDVDAAVVQAQREAGLSPWPDGDPGEDNWPVIECAPPPPSPLALYRDAMRQAIAAITADAARAARLHGMRSTYTKPPWASLAYTGADGDGLYQLTDHLQTPHTALGRRTSSDPVLGRRRVCLRPGRGHWLSTDDPEPNIAYARRARISEVEFQHYHAMPDDFIDRIADVVVHGPPDR